MTDLDLSAFVDLLNTVGVASVAIVMVIFIIRIWWNLFSEMTLR